MVADHDVIPRPRPRWRPLSPGTLTWALAAGPLLLLPLSLAALPASWRLSPSPTDTGYLVVELVQVSVLLAVTILLTLHGIVGWTTRLLVVAAGLHAVSVATTQYALIATAPGWSSSGEQWLPFGTTALWLQSWLWVPATGAMAVLLPVLLAAPTGRRSRPHLALVLAGAVALAAMTVAVATSPDPLLASGAEPNPMARAGEGWLDVAPVLVVTALAAAGPLLLWARRRTLRGPERATVTAYLIGDTLLVVALAFEATGLVGLHPLGEAWSWSLQLATLPLLPVTVLAASARAGRWSARPLIGLTTRWFLLLVSLGWLVVGGTSLLSLRDTTPPLVVVAASVALGAAAVLPLRHVVDGSVERLVYGERRQPLRVLEDLVGRLARDGVDGPGLQRATESVAHRMQLVELNVELRTSDGWQPVAGTGQGAQRWLDVPARHDGELVGRVRAGLRPAERFADADLALLEMVADQLAAAVVSQRRLLSLEESRRRNEAIRGTERRRLGQDLHDELGPTLAGISFGLRAVRNDVAAGRADAVVALVEVLSDQASGAVEQVRRLAYDLHPPWLEAGGLAEALQQHVALVRATSGLTVRLDLPEPVPSLSSAVQLALYRVSVEAITNVVRHAVAERCWVTVTVGAEVRIEVSDDGRGVHGPAKSGIGTATMAARARELGGSLTIARRRPGGTTVVMTVPNRPENGDGRDARGDEDGQPEARHPQQARREAASA